MVECIVPDVFVEVGNTDWSIAGLLLKRQLILSLAFNMVAFCANPLAGNARAVSPDWDGIIGAIGTSRRSWCGSVSAASNTWPNPREHLADRSRARARAQRSGARMPFCNEELFIECSFVEA